MFSVDENLSISNPLRVQNVQTLIIGRLVVIFLLLVTSWVWYTGSAAFSFEQFRSDPLIIFVIAVGLTTVYFFLLRLSLRLAWQVRMQFVLDSLLITWLIWRTGGLTSPYVTLYIVLIGVSSLYLPPRLTLTMAIICGALFVVLSLLTFLSIIEGAATTPTLSKIIQILSFNIVAILVVGLLASKLSERRYSGAELAEATRHLASLRALHERIIESIRSGLVTTDLSGQIFTFNQAAAEITGHSAEETIGKPISTLFGDLSQATALSIEAAASGEQPPRFEVDLTTPEGFAVRVGYSIAQLYSEESEASGLIMTFQDLTAIRSMEESVRRKDRLAAVGRVGAGLAHEIRNPLGAMRGAIQVLESNTPPNSVQSDLMGIILKESDRLNSIITNFLSYAKPKVGSFAEVDACEALRETIKLLRHSPDLLPRHEMARPPAEPASACQSFTKLFATTTET
ncbi:MAG: PAS domain S-box protein [Acidobacteria bacterium]|nr:PAS domain S-box protein [Acidobacteriota bacterium]